MKPLLHVQGMHGLGDNLHQRAVLRQLMTEHRVVLETSWASVYHDLLGDDLKVVRKPSGLRTQTKNAARESDLFTPMTLPAAKRLRVSYGAQQIMATQSKTILEAMCNATGTSYAQADYSLPVPEAWDKQIMGLPFVGTWLVSGKPLLVYRPLVARPEWRGSVARNADPASYATILQWFRDEFFVVSVADLAPTQEWIVGPQLRADATFHKGELSFEQLAALFSLADLVYTSSGFAAILAPAVGTACLSIVGGYELPGCHDSAKRFAPYLAIGPDTPCSCWTSTCQRLCIKRIEMLKACGEVRQFLSENDIRFSDSPRPLDEMFQSAEKPSRPPATVFERQMRR